MIRIEVAWIGIGSKIQHKAAKKKIAIIRCSTSLIPDKGKYVLGSTQHTGDVTHKLTVKHLDKI